jgi:hypothetical protein
MAMVRNFVFILGQTLKKSACIIAQFYTISCLCKLFKFLNNVRILGRLVFLQNLLFYIFGTAFMYVIFHNFLMWVCVAFW